MFADDAAIVTVVPRLGFGVRVTPPDDGVGVVAGAGVEPARTVYVPSLNMRKAIMDWWLFSWRALDFCNGVWTRAVCHMASVLDAM